MTLFDRPANPPPFSPSEEWIDQFGAQCTEALYESGRALAAHRAQAIRRAGGHVDDYYAREIVADVVGDTLEGVLRWDPGAQSLESHVLDAVRSRTSHDYIRATKYRHESIDGLETEAPDGLLAEIEAALPGWRSNPAAAALASECLDCLRALAASDAVVLRMLDAFVAGAVTKADVTHSAGLSPNDYHVGRLRLRRLVVELLGLPAPRRRNVKKGA